MVTSALLLDATSATAQTLLRVLRRRSSCAYIIYQYLAFADFALIAGSPKALFNTPALLNLGSLSDCSIDKKKKVVYFT